MTENQSLDLIWGIGALVIVGSALLARRAPIGQMLKMALAWVAIFAVGLAIYAYREELYAVGARIWAEIDPPEAVVEGRTLRIAQSTDGHFWVDVVINGQTERFLIDSGASITGISVGTAQRSGIEADFGYPMVLNTANGAIDADRATAETLVVGTIRREHFPVVIAEEFGGTNVLGMNFLSSLSGWSVEGDTMILQP